METTKNPIRNDDTKSATIVPQKYARKVRIEYIILTMLTITVCMRVILSQPQNWQEKKEVHRETIIIDFPYTRGTTQILKVKSTHTAETNKQMITIYTTKYPQYQVKDIIEIDGKMAKNNTVHYPDITKKANSATWIEKKLFQIKESLQQNIKHSMAEPYASIAQGMLLGTNTGMPQEVTKVMQRAGTMHMLVASGFNITMITAFILKTAGIIKRKSSLIIAAGAVLMFIVITGAQPPVLRAGIMGLLALSAQWLGRPAQSKRILIITITSILIIWPQLLYSLSFQLSALATAGIIFISPILDEKNQKEQKNRFIHYIVTEGKTTLAAQCAVIPLILNTFGNLSIIAPITNLATAWAVPYIMIGAFLTSIAGYANKNVADICGGATTAITYSFLLIQQVCTALPFIYFENIKMNHTILAGIYIIMAAIIIKYADKNKSAMKKNEL